MGGFVLVATAVLAQLHWSDVWGPKAYLLLYPAIFFAALLGGAVPGILGTGAASVCAVYFFLPPAGSFGMLDGAEILGLVIFAGTGVLFSLLSELVRKSLKKEREAQAALLQAVRVRDEFLSIASHELKTPLTSLKLQLQMAQRSLRVMGQPPAQLEKITRGIEVSSRQVDRLQTLVESLLDVARIQAGRLTFQFERVDLTLLVQEVTERFTEVLAAAKCPLVLNFDGAILVQADRFRLEQVVVNLLSNAIKYGAGKPIHVSVRLEGDKGIIAVRDFGMGIQVSKLGKVFERFERAGQGSNISGLGLGLYISKQIVDGHSGKILVDSKPGEGASFQVEVPAVQAAVTH